MTDGSKHPQTIVYHHQNPIRLGLPWSIQAIMFAVFSIPLMFPLLTWKLVPEMPWIVLLWPIALFPMGVMYMLARLMSRYGVTVYATGDTLITFPFQRVSIKREQLASIVLEKNYVAATKSYMSWLRFADKSGKVITSLSPQALPDEALGKYLEALQSTNPALIIKL